MKLDLVKCTQNYIVLQITVDPRLRNDKDKEMELK